MKKNKKLISILLVFATLFVFSVSAAALSLDDDVDKLKAEFEGGEGPVVGEYSIDYRYYSPVKAKDRTKYPLVIWLHGMGDGSYEGAQVEKSNIAYWASDEFQSRFKPAGGAFILAARSREEDGITWENSMIEPLRAAIDEFIALNGKNIDLSRIYVGGYSMGGKMTLKMAVAYPEMFAAAFPICPAWAPDDTFTTHLADMPVWITSSTLDPLVNYQMAVTPTWERITENSNIPEKCRLSTIGKVCYPDGTPTSSAHHTWFAVNYDMFSVENGAYPNMTTVNGLGEEVTLTYPDGMISWLSEQTSDYDGTALDGTGNIDSDSQTDNFIDFGILTSLFEKIFSMIRYFINML